MEIRVPPKDPFLFHDYIEPYFAQSEAMVAELERLVADIQNNMDHKDTLTLIGFDEDELVRLHHGFGTFLRNKYNLWNTQEDKPKSILTKRWCEDPSTHDIRNGTDYSIDHPDSVSMMLIKLVYHKCIYDRAP